MNTSAGIILIDTLFGYRTGRNRGRPEQSRPRSGQYQIIVVSHVHDDYDGALKFLQNTYKPRVILSPMEWELAAREASPPTHDIDATDGQKIDSRLHHHHHLYHPRTYRRHAFLPDTGHLLPVGPWVGSGQMIRLPSRLGNEQAGSDRRRTIIACPEFLPVDLNPDCGAESRVARVWAMQPYRESIVQKGPQERSYSMIFAPES